MDISGELKEAIAKVRGGIAETMAGSSEITDSVKKGATEASNRALNNTQKAMAKVKEALVEAEATSVKEAEATKVTVEEHLHKAGVAITDAGEELAIVGAQVKAKSIGGTEKAVTEVQKALHKVEELIAKIK